MFYVTVTIVVKKFQIICLCLLRNVISYQALYLIRENVEGNNITKVLCLVRRNLANDIKFNIFKAFLILVLLKKISSSMKCLELSFSAFQQSYIRS